MTSLDLRLLRSAFGKFVTGVTVVTAINEDGDPVGFTANSYTSVSLDPPLLLVCPAKSLSCFDVFHQCAHFAVNILSESQQDIANTFASAHDDRFSTVEWQPNQDGCPVLSATAASFSCSTRDCIDAGDHLILLGEVDHFTADPVAGLAYSDNGYFSIGLERLAAELPRPKHPVTVGVIVEQDGRILVVETKDGLRLPQTETTGMTGSLAAIRNYLDSFGVDVEFGPVYSIFENHRSGEYSTFYRGVSISTVPEDLGRFVALDELVAMKFSSGSVTDMIGRYVLERQSGVFCLYIGDEIGGDVHMFGQG